MKEVSAKNGRNNHLSSIPGNKRNNRSNIFDIVQIFLGKVVDVHLGVTLGIFVLFAGHKYPLDMSLRRLSNIKGRQTHKPHQLIISYSFSRFIVCNSSHFLLLSFGFPQPRTSR